MSSGAQLIEVHVCARPAARRSESAFGTTVVTGISTVRIPPSIPLLPRVTRVDEPRMTREGRRRIGGRSGGWTLIKPS